jgi:hypothetical protein
VRLGDRLSGTALALLLQGGFLLLLLQSVQVFTRATVAPRELTLVLPRLKPAPEPVAPARSGGVTAAPPRAFETPLPAPPAAAPDAGALKGFGQSLFGCAPEAYALLSPEDRAHCPKPGENAPLTAEQELYPKSHSKDAATWQEDLDERHFDYSACVGAEKVMACMYRMMAQEKARKKQTRTFIESDNARRDADAMPRPPLPDIPVRRGR